MPKGKQRQRQRQRREREHRRQEAPDQDDQNLPQRNTNEDHEKEQGQRGPPLVPDIRSIFRDSPEQERRRREYSESLGTLFGLRDIYAESKKEECEIVEQFGEKYLGGVPYGRKTNEVQLRAVMEVYETSEEHARLLCQEDERGVLKMPQGNEVLDIIHQLTTPLFHFEYTFAAKLTNPAKRDALQHLLTLCEYHREEGEKQFQQRVRETLEQFLPVLMGCPPFHPMCELEKAVDEYHGYVLTLYDTPFVKTFMEENSHRLLFLTLRHGAETWAQFKITLEMTYLAILLQFVELMLYEEHLKTQMLEQGYDVDVSSIREVYPRVRPLYDVRKQP